MAPLQAALRLLARREYAAVELSRRLLLSGYAAADVAQALAACQAKGYRSDERFAGQLCRTRIAQGYGPLKIGQELRMHGIDPAWIKTIAEQEQVDWHAQAAAQLKKHAWRFKESADKSKPTRLLLARGFSAAVIQHVLSISYENL